MLGIHDLEPQLQQVKSSYWSSFFQISEQSMKTPIRTGEKVVFEPRVRSLDEGRWRRNAIANLAEGVTLVPSGKAASVYFRSGAQVLELAGEMATIQETE